MATEGSVKAIFAAFFANAGIAVLKLVGFFFYPFGVAAGRKHPLLCR